MKIFDHDKKVIHYHLKTGPGRGLYDFHLCHFVEGNAFSQTIPIGSAPQHSEFADLGVRRVLESRSQGVTRPAV